MSDKNSTPSATLLSVLEFIEEAKLNALDENEDELVAIISASIEALAAIREMKK